MNIRTRDDAFVLVAEILASFVGIEAGSITPDLRVDADLGLDSIDAVELLITVEKRTGLHFDDEQLEGIDTVDSLVDRLLTTALEPSGASAEVAP